MIEFIIPTLFILFGLMSIAYVGSRLIKNSGVVDIFWGMGIAFVGLYFLFTQPLSLPRIIIVSLVFIWAIRLSGYLFFNRILPKHRDHRYENLTFSLLANYYLQAALQTLICLLFYPVFFRSSVSINEVSLILFLIALIGESIADQQLSNFKKNNTGVCRVGLWSISRHPNYFFEVLIWTSLAWMTSSWIAAIAPLTLWIIVAYVTGPYTERFSLERKGNEFKTYQLEVPMIIPRLPKRNSMSDDNTMVKPIYIKHLNQSIQCDYLKRTQVINHPKQIVFDFFSNAKNLEHITPPFLNFKIEKQSTPSIQKNTIFDYKLKIHGIPIRWKSKITEWNPIHEFVDVQLKGPYKVWHHTHRFSEYQGGTLIEDEIYYAVSKYSFINWIVRPFIKRDVHNIFNYRKKCITSIFK